MTDKLHFDVCAAICNNRGFGFKNDLPWPKLRGDYEYYTELTSKTKNSDKKCARIQGRLTWLSTDETQKSDLNVINYVISKDIQEYLRDDPNVHVVVSSLEEAIADISSTYRNIVENIWIMGGQKLYEEAVNHPCCRRIYLTKIYGDFESDRFFPVFENFYKEISDPDVDGSLKEENGISYQFKVYERIN